MRDRKWEERGDYERNINKRELSKQRSKQRKEQITRETKEKEKEEQREEEKGMTEEIKRENVNNRKKRETGG